MTGADAEAEAGQTLNQKLKHKLKQKRKQVVLHGSVAKECLLTRLAKVEAEVAAEAQQQQVVAAEARQKLKVAWQKLEAAGQAAQWTKLDMAWQVVRGRLDSDEAEYEGRSQRMAFHAWQQLTEADAAKERRHKEERRKNGFSTAMTTWQPMTEQQQQLHGSPHEPNSLSHGHPCPWPVEP